MRKFFRILTIVICLLLCAGGAFFMFQEEEQKEDLGQIYEEVQKQFGPEEREPLQVEMKPVEIPIDFAGLKEINEDIYAWIDIPDTNIHYPIVQHPTDDTYYLEHTVEGEKGLPGSIYTERVNAKDFSDFNTVIYGHNMKNGTMFKHLHKYEDSDFFESHDKMTIYTETEMKEYQIIAAVLFDDRHLMYSFDWDTEAGRLAYVKALREAKTWNKFWREGAEVTGDSKLVTLSTCVGGQSDRRFLVVGMEME